MNENTNNTNTIRAYFNQFSSKGILFMDDRDKGDIKTLVGDVLHIDDFGFINGRDGEYAVVSFKEHPESFYFAGLALTDICRKIDADGMREELAAQPIVLTMKKSKNNRSYMSVDFLDND